MNIDVRADVREVERMLGRIGSDIVPKAAASALNRTISAAKTEAIKAIRDEVGESERGGLKLSKAFTVYGASWQRLTATLVARSYPVPLIYFNPKQTATGVVAIIAGKRIERPGAFIKKIYGAKSVWLRKYRGKGSSAHTPPGRLRGRFPVKKLYGPRVGNVMLTPRVKKRIEDIARKKWPELFEKAIKFRISRL